MLNLREFAAELKVEGCPVLDLSDVQRVPTTIAAIKAAMRQAVAHASTRKGALTWSRQADGREHPTLLSAKKVCRSIVREFGNGGAPAWAKYLPSLAYN